MQCHSRGAVCRDGLFGAVGRRLLHAAASSFIRIHDEWVQVGGNDVEEEGLLLVTRFSGLRYLTWFLGGGEKARHKEKYWRLSGGYIGEEEERRHYWTGGDFRILPTVKVV